jgi:hypothetical protein
MYDEVIQVSPNDVHSTGWVKTATADGQQHYVLTGVIVPHLKGGAGDWRHVTLKASITLPDLAPGQQFVASQWAPFVAVAAVAEEVGDAVSGWAVDGYSLATPDTPQPVVNLEIQAAVRDVSAFLLRLSYSIHVVGTYA